MKRPTIDCQKQHPVLSVPDVGAAADFFVEKLGFDLGFLWGDPPSYAGVNLGEVQVFLNKGTANPAGLEICFVVGDADELLAFHRAQGAEILVDIGDRDYGIRDYSVRDLNGYRLTFGHHIFSDGDAIPIERVDVPVRLEKRLAALLTDLAAKKRMSMSSLFEETFLHTLDGVGPHTPGDLRHIEALKAKHGIDYDSHGSYRFREE